MTEELTGELRAAMGPEGARRAKQWLESTTRAEARFDSSSPVTAAKLTYRWSDDASFSFDLGGFLRGEPFDSEEFLAEVKLYSASGDQGTLYRQFLAKCAVARKVAPARCDHFMWITWAPFLATKWDEITKPGYVRESLAEWSEKAFGERYKIEDVDESLAQDVAKRLWLIVLSEKQEKHLRVGAKHLGLIEAAIKEEAHSGY